MLRLVRSLRRWFTSLAVGGLLMAAAATEGNFAVAADAPVHLALQPPRRAPANLEEEALQNQPVALQTLKIQNQTQKPFVYQISRTSGACWSHAYTLLP